MFSSTASDHIQSPRNLGPLLNATHVGKVGVEGDGPHMYLWLVIAAGTIRQASYGTYGCPAAMASGSMVAQLLIGRTVEQARLIEPRDVELLLGGLPEGKGHCPQMAVEALRRALGDS